MVSLSDLEHVPRVLVAGDRLLDEASRVVIFRELRSAPWLRPLNGAEVYTPRQLVCVALLECDGSSELLSVDGLSRMTHENGAPIDIGRSALSAVEES